MLPPPFERRMQELLGPEELAAFLAALQEPPPVSIRLNPLKRMGDGQWPRDGTFDISCFTEVPWHPNGFYLPKRPVFTLDPCFHAGAYYVQEASSMFLYEALRQTVDFSKPLKILDLCAAPGGKSTLLADMLYPTPDPSPNGRGVRDGGAEGIASPLPLGDGMGLLVANEVIRPRVGVLRENLEKWGAPNIAVTSAEAEEFAALEDFFDVIVTDAPCSGEGLFRKDPDAIGEWSPDNVELCSGRQRRILMGAVMALKPGGILAYSTCTYNRSENEDNAEWMTQHFDLELLQLETPADWGIVATDCGYRFFPHRLRGEGFFITVFRKKEGVMKKQTVPSVFKNIKPLAKNLVPEVARWLNDDLEVRFFQTPSGNVLALPAALEATYLVLDKFLKNKWFGTPVGAFKGKDFIPSHALALSRLVSPTLPALDLEREQALRFLKKETFDLPSDTPRGWTLARYAGLNLGWMKVLPGRMNNYLPPERRIRMSLHNDEG
jgi:16S rRNA C967 or C1407 C5-methylase (RsmB/RsmF family)/NOL1/NOP2/fmu family ribosome biogenesis protein